METREEKLAQWVDSSIARMQSLRILEGSLSLNPNDLDKRVHISEDKIRFDQIEEYLLNSHGDTPNLWHIKAISFPRVQPGRLALSMSKQVFHKIQDPWNLHPRTIEVFLSNNGVFTTFHSPSSERTSLLFKVANSRSIGFDCVSVTCDYSRRHIYALYHHLPDEALLFATLLSTPERCIDPHFFIAALHRSHHQMIETYRNAIDDAIKDIERQTGFGSPGRGFDRQANVDKYPVLADPQDTIQRLSYCQTELAIIGHTARCCSDCGEWLVRAIDERLLDEQAPQYGRQRRNGYELHQLDQQSLESLRAVQLLVRQDVEYMRRRTVTLLSQVQQLRDRVQSQVGFILNTVTQSDAEYTAAIAVDGKRDSIAMKTIAILGIVFLPGTFVATLFSINMFDWGDPNSGEANSLTVSRSIWIYWAITVPLTILTFLIWMFWSRSENNKTSKRLMIYRKKGPVKSENAALMKDSGLFSSDKIV